MMFVNEQTKAYTTTWKRPDENSVEQQRLCSQPRLRLWTAMPATAFPDPG